MPSPLLMTITDAGMDALVAAEVPGSDAIVIATLGLTATTFVQAPTLTAIPGQFKVLDALAGVSASPNIIHVSCYDNSDDEYDLRGFGLYLDDGTLFAVYCSTTGTVLSKGELAIGLIALDIAFSNDVGGMIEFGTAIFAYPPATETTKGVAKIATQARVDAAEDAGDDAETIVTPKTLRSRLASIITYIGATYALKARTVTGGGVATGGGDLSANRTITVTAASQARVDDLADAFGDDAIVVTPKTLRVRLAAMLSALNTTIGVVATSVATLNARNINAGGIATGGGTLAADRTITVTAASQARVDDLADAVGDDILVVTPKTLRVRLAAMLSALNTTIGVVATSVATLNARNINAGGIATGGGTLAADRTITVTAASQARVDDLADAAGDDAIVVTPKTLRVRLAAMLAAITTLSGRTITGGGVATGGGNLTANRVITVEAAEEADLDVGTSTTKVIVVSLLGIVRVFTAFGRFRIFGFEIKWGRFSATADTNTYVTFPVAFPNGLCFAAISTGTRQVGTDQDNYTATVPGSETGSGFTAYNGHSAAVPSSYIAIGS